MSSSGSGIVGSSAVVADRVRDSMVYVRGSGYIGNFVTLSLAVVC